MSQLVEPLVWARIQTNCLIGLFVVVLVTPFTINNPYDTDWAIHMPQTPANLEYGHETVNLSRLPLAQKLFPTGSCITGLWVSRKKSHCELFKNTLTRPAIYLSHWQFLPFLSISCPFPPWSILRTFVLSSHQVLTLFNVYHYLGWVGQIVHRHPYFLYHLRLCDVISLVAIIGIVISSHTGKYFCF